MRALSISAAWDEVRAILARDGRLYATVALALLAFPSAINTLINPGGVGAQSLPAWVMLVTLVATLIALVGQLAMIRLALGPSTTVGAAIAHGMKRMPIYFASILLMGAAFFVLVLIVGVVLALIGAPVAASNMKIQLTPATLVGLLFCLAITIYCGVRLMLSAPIATAEPAGPFAILKRSWMLTQGRWLPLFGFIVIFAIGALIVIMATGSVIGLAVRLTLGAIEPLSAAALVFGIVQSVVGAAVSALFALMLARIYAQIAGHNDGVAEVFR